MAVRGIIVVSIAGIFGGRGGDTVGGSGVGGGVVEACSGIVAMGIARGGVRGTVPGHDVGRPTADGGRVSGARCSPVSSAVICPWRAFVSASLAVAGGVVAVGSGAGRCTACAGHDVGRPIADGVAMVMAMIPAGGTADGAAMSAGEPTDGMSLGTAGGISTGMARGPARSVRPIDLRSSRSVADLACSCSTVRASSSACRLSSMTFGVHAGVSICGADGVVPVIEPFKRGAGGADGGTGRAEGVGSADGGTRRAGVGTHAL